MKVSEFFSLLWLNFVVAWRNTVEFFKVALLYYPSSFSFFKVDIALRLMYLFHNPYRISKRFLQKRGDADVYAYGETPLTALELIAKECGIKEGDHVFELGAGCGRTCFWLNSFIGCSVVGIEQVPDFVERATLIQRRLGIDGVEFRCCDILKGDYTGATVCYLYGTCMDDADVSKLAARLALLPPGTKVITVSYPITDYSKQPAFEVLKCFPVAYTWGTADVYLQVVKK